jgi:hypothetical protein
LRQGSLTCDIFNELRRVDPWIVYELEVGGDLPVNVETLLKYLINGFGQGIILQHLKSWVL